jgi:hypothetical protein
MWRFDQTFVANLENQRAFGEIGTRLSAMPGKACRRA